MGKRVVVIASGETERRALSHLVKQLETDGVSLLEVRIPPRHNALNVAMAEKLIKATWYERIAAPPDKFVILLDVDGKMPVDVLDPFRQQLPIRLGTEISAALQFAYAQWHLEAWFFADEQGLRGYLGASLGNVDSSAPDQIQNPKEHLKHLLNQRAYTAVVCEEIAKALDAGKIRQRSQSFCAFLEAMRNGLGG
ncbi:MAG TPA: DUF4276 family protein [Tepidisphaeraceae bacterium]|nr:DUF4276 family protein [Tepidisphaeraceae bacterium]